MIRNTKCCRNWEGDNRRICTRDIAILALVWYVEEDSGKSSQSVRQDTRHGTATGYGQLDAKAPKEDTKCGGLV
jgi:hypothetical protein